MIWRRISPPGGGGGGGPPAEGGRISEPARSLASLTYPPLTPPFQGGEE
jgi:hypothetical protein